MTEELIKFDTYDELRAVTREHPQIVILNMKDGSKYYFLNQDHLAEYSGRADVDSFLFFYEGDEIPDAGVQTLDAGIETVATVEVPSVPVQTPPKPPEGSSLPMLVGALSGALASVGTPAITNFVKSLIQDRLRGKRGESKDEQPTDCKTHQIRANLRFNGLSSRLSALESKPSMPELPVDLEELEERVEHLERVAKLKKLRVNNKK